MKMGHMAGNPRRLPIVCCCDNVLGGHAQDKQYVDAI